MADMTYDLLAIGRSCIDLYSNDIGARFADIRSFAAYVGGSPTNVCAGAARLGLKTAMLTAVGPDPVGEFVSKFLREQNVDASFIPTKPGYRTSAVLLGIEPPDKFPLIYYRADAADVQISIDDALAAPVEDSRIVLIAGTNLTRDPLRSATIYAAERARAAGAEVVLVLDLRADQWHDLRAFGVAVRSVLRVVDIVIGTADEVKAAMLTGGMKVSVEHSQVSEAHVTGDLERAVELAQSYGVKVLAMTRGSNGAAVHVAGAPVVEAAPYPVEIYNTIGAGDAFAAGLLYGHLRGWDWRKAARMGNACGAIVVTRHGCSNFMPYEQEALDFVASRGGF
jgi:5-dehydro-2-deoxygluconokinase